MRAYTYTVSPPSRAAPQPSTLEALQSEMKLLHWHKLANEAALKAALIRTKKMRAVDKKNPATETLKEKAEYMQQVIEEEQVRLRSGEGGEKTKQEAEARRPGQGKSVCARVCAVLTNPPPPPQAKPLQVGKEYILKYEEEEVKNEAKLQKQVEHHVSCLKNLRQSIERRETIKNRKAQFKEFKEQVDAERKAVMEGKISAANRFKTSAKPNQEEEMPPPPVKGTLSTVIGSLDKLVELEKRISSLETDNLHDRVTDGASVPMQVRRREGGGGGGEGEGEGAATKDHTRQESAMSERGTESERRGSTAFRLCLHRIPTLFTHTYGLCSHTFMAFVHTRVWLTRVYVEAF